jgi:hypothetical protein
MSTSVANYSYMVESDVSLGRHRSTKIEEHTDVGRETIMRSQVVKDL